MDASWCLFNFLFLPTKTILVLCSSFTSLEVIFNGTILKEIRESIQSSWQDVVIHYFCIYFFLGKDILAGFLNRLKRLYIDENEILIQNRKKFLKLFEPSSMISVKSKMIMKISRSSFLWFVSLKRIKIMSMWTNIKAVRLLVFVFTFLL